VSAVSPSAAERSPRERARRQGGFDLGALTLAVFNVNRVFCTVDNIGDVCLDPRTFSSGGFWPKGTPNDYIYNSGLQVAGMIPEDAGFEWAGDTVGVFFVDLRAGRGEGDAVSLVFNSIDLDDFGNWPDQAIVRDTATYNDVLIGLKSVAQQDLWVRYWDGNPAIQGRRLHPMGILVEERGLGWNYPSGNEDIVYFIYTFYNITASDRSVYDGLHSGIRDSVADIAESYVEAVEEWFEIDIPAQGYSITDFYAAFTMDPDIAGAFENFSTAILPFDMGVGYQSNFQAPSFTYQPDPLTRSPERRWGSRSSPTRPTARHTRTRRPHPSCGATSPATTTEAQETPPARSRTRRSAGSATCRASPRIPGSSSPRVRCSSIPETRRQ
jgi:hypothetical protein